MASWVNDPHMPKIEILHRNSGRTGNSGIFAVLYLDAKTFSPVDEKKVDFRSLVSRPKISGIRLEGQH